MLNVHEYICCAFSCSFARPFARGTSHKKIITNVFFSAHIQAVIKNSLKKKATTKNLNMYYPSGAVALGSVLLFHETKGDTNAAQCIRYDARGTNWYHRRHITSRRKKELLRRPAKYRYRLYISLLVFVCVCVSVHFFLLVLFSFCVCICILFGGRW